jgi:hypothetical protein
MLHVVRILGSADGRELTPVKSIQKELIEAGSLCF